VKIFSDFQKKKKLSRTRKCQTLNFQEKMILLKRLQKKFLQLLPIIILKSILTALVLAKS